MKVVSHKAARTLSLYPAAGRDSSVRNIVDAVHRLNEAIRAGVDSGISVELSRVSRCHDGCGNWGDQMVPVIRG